MHRPTEKNPLHSVVLAVVFSLLMNSWQGTFALEESLSFEQLIEELEDPDSDGCWDAINTLGLRGDKRAVPYLMTALEKDMIQRKGIAMAIIPALGQLGDKQAVPLLLKALNNMDEDWLGREAAAIALGEIGAAEAVPSLIRAAWLPETRNAAIEALASIGDPRATMVLLSTLDGQEDPEAQKAAIEGLMHIGKPAVPALIEKLERQSKEYPQDHQRALAAMILGEISDQRSIDPLTRALDDPSAEVRKSADTALRKMTQ
jgi:HEAT repeat protein